MNNLPNNPQIIPHKSGQEFRYFCQKVLPAVYDESLSYYELLCKLTAKINEIINTQNTQVDSITELQNLFVELTDYVNNYFLELNVQEQINNKLDIMSSDGTLAQIINEQIFDELNSKIDVNTQDITSLGGRVTNAESDIQTNKDDIQSNSEAIQTNTASIATVNGRVDSLETVQSETVEFENENGKITCVFRRSGNVVVVQFYVNINEGKEEIVTLSDINVPSWASPPFVTGKNRFGLFYYSSNFNIIDGVLKYDYASFTVNVYQSGVSRIVGSARTISDAGQNFTGSLSYIIEEVTE